MPGNLAQQKKETLPARLSAWRIFRIRKKKRYAAPLFHSLLRGAGREELTANMRKKTLGSGEVGKQRVEDGWGRGGGNSCLVPPPPPCPAVQHSLFFASPLSG